MKKLLSVLLATALVVTSASGVMAKGKSLDKSVDVSLEFTQEIVVSEDGSTEVLTGEDVDLEVATQKKGSSYKLIWEITKDEVKVDDVDYIFGEETSIEQRILEVEGEESKLVDYHVTTASFNSEEAGTFVVTAKVELSAGQSHVTWDGEASKTIDVFEPEELVIEKAIFDVLDVKRSGVSANYDVWFNVSIKYVGIEEPVHFQNFSGVRVAGEEKKSGQNSKNTLILKVVIADVEYTHTLNNQ